MENNKIIMISLELPVEANARIKNVLEEMGGISRSAFIRQAILEKLHKAEAQQVK